MSKAIVIRDYGGPEVLRLEDVQVGAPGPGELQIRQTAIGVNFHDVYVRTGLYRTLAVPGIPGNEAAAVVVRVGPGVEGFVPGDRIAYVTDAYGAYASERLLPAALAIKLADTLDDRLAASILLKGLTVEMLVHRVHQIDSGMTILVHAAAGGVGQLLCQWASSLGATVVGTVGTLEKAAIAKAAGCAHTILYRDLDWRAEVRDFTGGRGVDVVYDSVGCDTLAGSIDVLAKLGHLVNFGQSSGPVDPVSMSTLATKSLSITRPILFHYLEDPTQMRAMAEAVFSAFSDGRLKADAGSAFPLGEAARAHTDLEARAALGSLILIPDGE